MNTQFPTCPQSRRRGIALLLVVFVMALAAILGYAMLSASSIQATASSNAAAAAVAHAQAESGIHLAMYYLTNPANAPCSPPCTWSNVRFASVTPASTIPGSVTIQASALDANHCCTIISTGSSDSSSGFGIVTRTITAKVQVGAALPINHAGAFNSLVTINGNSSFTSNAPNVAAVASTGIVTNNGTVTGNIIASSVNGTGTQTLGTVLPVSSTTLAPSIGNVTDFTAQYYYQGAFYSPVAVTSPLSGSLAPTASNPLGIYFVSGNLSVNAPLTVNGTLVVKGGNMTNSSTISITPVSPSASTNMPALVVSGSLTISGASRTLNANGVVYIGTGIKGTGSTSTSQIAVNGALMVTSGGINNSFAGQTAVTFNPSLTTIPNFDIADWNSTAGVKIVSWSE